MAPSWIRRPVTITVWLTVSVLGLVLSPLLFGAAAVAGALTGRPEPLILCRLVVGYFARELATLVACGGLWCLSGAGWLMRSPLLQTLHWRLLRWFACGLASLARSLLGIEVTSHSAPEVARAFAADTPLLIFSRHAGPGDAVLLIDELLSRHRRRPSVVFKEALALDPSIDLIAHRLPHAVLDTDDRERCEAQIEQVAAELTPRGALVLFPEGGNFTPERRRSALATLRRKGRHRTAAKAEQMPHVLPPRPSGALAALRGNPGADVIFAAHTGLGLATYPGELWRDMPIGRTLRTCGWLVRAGEVPRDPNDQVTWLFDWWARIDQWIAAQGSEPPGVLTAATRPPPQ
jgi:1-acyl-sn-glycerol-3-phosphate acyltransferase